LGIVGLRQGGLPVAWIRPGRRELQLRSTGIALR